MNIKFISLMWRKPSRGSPSSNALLKMAAMPVPTSKRLSAMTTRRTLSCFTKWSRKRPAIVSGRRMTPLDTIPATKGEKRGLEKCSMPLSSRNRFSSIAVWVSHTSALELDSSSALRLRRSSRVEIFLTRAPLLCRRRLLSM